MAHRIEVVTDECMSSGKCVHDLPSVFAFDDDELALVRADAEQLSDEQLIQAARNCPSQALQVFDETGTRIET